MFAISFVQIKTLKHALTTSTHTDKFTRLMEIWRRLGVVENQINETISKTVSAPLEFSRNDIFKQARVNCPLRYPLRGNKCMRARERSRVISRVGVYGWPLVCKRDLEHLQVYCFSTGYGNKRSPILENESTFDADPRAALGAKAICIVHQTHNTMKHEHLQPIHQWSIYDWGFLVLLPFLLYNKESISIQTCACLNIVLWNTDIN